MDNNNEQSFDEAYETKKMYGEPYQELKDFFMKTPKGKVLDLGCGQGRDSLYLASIGYDVTGIDLSDVGIKQMLDEAKTQGLKIKGISGDILKLDIQERFDIVLWDMVLHSFEKAQQMELLTKYSATGIFVIVFPDDMNTAYFMDLLSDSWELQNEIEVKDTPKMPEDDTEYVFRMIVVKRK